MSKDPAPAKREIAATGLQVTPVAMGCWPIAGITSVDVNTVDSEATLAAAFESGINFFDTAYSYGFSGESERCIGRVLGPYREQIVIASKGGQVWDEQRRRKSSASPQAILDQFAESQSRLDMEVIDIYYLHAPDPAVALQETATAFAKLLAEKQVRGIGISNASIDQIKQFASVCPLSVVQPPYNMLQRGIERDLIPFCLEQGISVVTFWPLMKGLLAGKLPRDHQFADGDSRANYPMFQGKEWTKNQDFVDVLRAVASELGRSVAEVVVNWTIRQTGITAALCGAKRPSQIEESARAMTWTLPEPIFERINQAITARGQIAS